MKPRTMNSVTN
uniref:Uncharacterized protein n=1 Tax=Anguilla anguilla TaxID=7936 RepID=A0A0E9TIZ1_ANGAN